MAPSVEMTRAADQEREDHKMSRMRTVWNPWRDMNRLRVELDQLSNGNWWPHVRSGASFPAINALQNEQGLTLTAELPGIDASQLEVHVDKDKCEAVYEKGLLTLKLARTPEHEPTKLTIKAG